MWRVAESCFFFLLSCEVINCQGFFPSIRNEDFIDSFKATAQKHIEDASKVWRDPRIPSAIIQTRCDKHLRILQGDREILNAAKESYAFDSLIGDIAKQIRRIGGIKERLNGNRASRTLKIRQPYRRPPKTVEPDWVETITTLSFLPVTVILALLLLKLVSLGNAL